MIVMNSILTQWNTNGLPECEAGQNVFYCWCASGKVYSHEKPDFGIYCYVDG